MSLPKQTIKSIMLKFGAERIQPKAIEVLIKYLEEEIRDVTERSRKWMEYAGRKTIFAKDVELALSVMKQK